MKISLNTMKQLTGLDLQVEELVERINNQIGQVEEIIDLNAKYKDIVIVKVVSAEKHPNADKLSVCLVDDAGVVDDVERDANGLVQVVCGAPNARAGMFAAWLPPKTVVPASFSDKEPFRLEAREIRGVVSNGMLAAGDELGINNDHEGIIDIVEIELPEDKELKAGVSFAEVFDLNDVVIDIENKMFTHRPDCFGQLGVAREIFAVMQPEPESAKATDIRFKEPDWYWKMPEFGSASRLELEVFNEAEKVVPRFMAVAMDGIQVQSSPLWLQTTLVRWGSKAINNVVDATNYVMLMTGQPTHAYDYDKLRGNKLGVRLAKQGEKAELLNGKTYELTEDDIVIVDGDGIVGLGGVMGGFDSEVTSDTRRVVLEVATFDMYTVRKTSMRYGLFTDAVTRFSKGQSPLQNNRVMRKLIEIIDGEQASKVFDLPDRSGQLDEVSVHAEIQVKPSFINERLGLNLTGYAIGNILRRVNFATYADDENEADSVLRIAAPYWRTDIELPEDAVEEVGRLFGFDKLPVELPSRSIAPASKKPLFELKRRIRLAMSKLGTNEVLTYSFVHENTLKKTEQDSAQAFRLSNALSPDLQYYRLSVLPSLLDKVHPNIKAGHDEFILYEIGKGHNKKYHADDDDGLPKELQFVDGVYASKNAKEGAAYFRMRSLVTALAQDLGFTLRFKPIVEVMDYPVTAPFDLERSAIIESRNGEFVGMVGELKQSVLRNFKLPAYTAAMTLDLLGLQNSTEAVGGSYRPLSRFPSVTQDISLKVPVATMYEDVFWLAWQTIENEQPGECDAKLEPLSIYQSDDDTEHKTITLRLTISSYEKTLTDRDVNIIMEAVAKASVRQFGG